MRLQVKEVKEVDAYGAKLLVRMWQGNNTKIRRKTGEKEYFMDVAEFPIGGGFSAGLLC